MALTVVEDFQVKGLVLCLQLLWQYQLEGRLLIRVTVIERITLSILFPHSNVFHHFCGRPQRRIVHHESTQDNPP